MNLSMKSLIAAALVLAPCASFAQQAAPEGRLAQLYAARPPAGSAFVRVLNPGANTVKAGVANGADQNVGPAARATRYAIVEGGKPFTVRVAGKPRTQPAVAAGSFTTLVLDGAYAPLRLSGEPALTAQQREAVWQMFSPNKALGLTGVRAAYDSLSGEIHASTASAILEDSRYIRDAVNDRMRQPSCSGPDDPRRALAPSDNQLSSNGCHGEMVGWMRALGAWGESDGDSNSASLDRNLSGFMLGTDKQLYIPWMQATYVMVVNKKALPHLPGATAVIAGLAQPQHQAYQQALIDKIAQAGLSERIVFLGEVPAGEVHRWYQRCLLCVACPRYEPFGLTPFEAAATGCALVCSRTGAFEQLVLPGVNGELVDTGDAPGLATAVRQVLADLPAAVQRGQAAQARVSQWFSLSKEAEGIGQVYQQLFDQGAPR